jgi:amino acid transporter
MATIVSSIASSILGAIGSWTGVFPLGQLTQNETVLAYIAVGFVSLFCFLGAHKTELRAEYWATVVVGAMLAGMYLRQPDRLFAIVSVSFVIVALTVTFVTRDSGSFSKVLRDFRTSRRTDHG